VFIHHTLSTSDSTVIECAGKMEIREEATDNFSETAAVLFWHNRSQENHSSAEEEERPESRY